MMDDKKIFAIRMLFGDAFAFVQSMKVNQTLSTVTLDQLIDEQIKRNGESSRSQKSKYDPYNFKSEVDSPAGLTTEPADSFQLSNPVSGTNLSNPTKLDRLLAISSAIESVVNEIMKEKPSDLILDEKYWDADQELK